MVKCKHCGKELKTTSLSYGGIVLKRCECEGAKAEREKKEETEKLNLAYEIEKLRIAKLMDTSGIPKRFESAKLEDYVQTTGNIKALEASKEYVKNFVMIRNQMKNGILFTGSRGVGKTFLSSAIGKALLERGVGVKFMSTVGALREVRSTFNSRQRSEAEIFEEYANAELLIVDDLGKENPTEWTVSTMYSIINARYESMLPVIITLNYSSRDLVKRMSVADNTTADAIIDRILEMCKVVTINGESWRRKTEEGT